MKHVSFIRHAKLEAPYDNYDKLTLAQLEALATQTVTPSINKQKAHIHTDTQRRLGLHQTDVILCATSVRAQQTAQIIQNMLPRPVQIIVSPLLDEIMFSPATLVTQNEYKRYGMQLIRDNLFAAIIHSTAGTEKIDAISARIRTLLLELEGLSDSNVVCVTHGFFMRFLQHYCDKGVDSKIDEQLLALQTNYTNLEGFRIQLNEN